MHEKFNGNYSYSLQMGVRDYELDSEGIVNNANYLHYMEHTRHQFCIKAGFPFKKMIDEGIVAVVRKIEIEYLIPLRSGDKFISCLNIKRKGPRFIFKQDIYKEDESLVASAEITIVALENGKLSKGDRLAAAFSDYL